MNKGKDKGQAQSVEMPSIKKIVHCPRCKAKIKVEFEIGLDMVMPALAGASLPMAVPPKEKEK